ncbi:MAG TPA: hypothetical protein VIJ47_02330 [Acidimicrobiales bacterium]
MHARRWGATLATLVVLGAACTGTTTSTSAATSDPGIAAPVGGRLIDAVCAGASTTTAVATVTAPELTEASGIVASPDHPGVWWTHNDSGDTARFFAVRADGTLAATATVADATATDWEDIAMGPAVGASAIGAPALYLADIGDNASARTEIVIHRVAEPDPARDAVVHDDQPLRLHYPDGPHDAEALIVDPDSGELVIVTKDWSLAGRSEVYRTSGSAMSDAPITLDHVATVQLPVATLVTGADISADGTVVALRSYDGVRFYRRPAGAPLWQAFASEPCTVEIPGEKQGEAVGFAPDGRSIMTISEGTRPVLHRTAA